MDDDQAVETLTRLGLSTYEARTFVALQRLGSGAASDVAEIADVPRSQVYGAAEGLVQRGLVDVQHGTPTRYRPVPPADARATLLDALEEAGERAFAHLDRVRGEHTEGTRSEEIWLVEGERQVTDRVCELVGGAERRVIYGAPEGDRFDGAVVDALHARAGAGAQVVVLDVGGAVPDELADHDRVSALDIPVLSLGDLPAGRTVLADDAGVLLSVLPGEGTATVSSETAFWSEDSAFARLLVALIGGWIDSVTESLPPLERR